jgi:hypothetical protein
MYEIAASIALVLSLLSAAGVAMLILKREDHANLESKLRNVELELADIVDRLTVWQRRDAGRQRRMAGDAAPEPGRPVQGELLGTDLPSTARKGELFALARARGLMR